MSAMLKPEASAPLVRLRDLGVTFVTRDRTVHAVNGVSLDLMPGEVMCILGESGSGKSVTLRALMKLLPKFARVSGGIEVAGKDVTKMSEGQLTAFRGTDVAMIFQEPMTAMDPVFTIGRQIAETVQRHEKVSRTVADARALELLELVQIPSAKRRLAAYPHELSGGLRQRAMIAVALACRPKLLLADEPTTALDATVQIQVLLLLRELQEKLNMGVIFVTHDLGVAGEIADKVAVMYAGRVVEEGPVGGLLSGPLHPYTQGLLGATVHSGMRGQRLTTIPGAPPMLDVAPTNCAFSPRCPQVRDECLARVPDLRSPIPGRAARCVLV
ncbi:ABC transporter ATP-binding protein [Roseococcus sp. YIM B11640]|uniref:ABC transporter ATP-binding protein n=1 Tax=Roseococcus sp. YIM B11640 TaxID=3133973 RepID=UPI003C7A97BB